MTTLVSAGKLKDILFPWWSERKTYWLICMQNIRRHCRSNMLQSMTNSVEVFVKKNLTNCRSHL